jgi:hypothetical protein
LHVQAYSQGRTAGEVMAQLQETDFLQSGGLVTSDVASAGGRATEINRELFVM